MSKSLRNVGADAGFRMFALLRFKTGGSKMLQEGQKKTERNITSTYIDRKRGVGRLRLRDVVRSI